MKKEENKGRVCASPDNTLAPVVVSPSKEQEWTPPGLEVNLAVDRALTNTRVYSWSPGSAVVFYPVRVQFKLLNAPLQ